MSRKIHASFLALVMIATFALTGGQAAVRTATAAPAATNDLLGMLPPSDIIAYVDTQRVLTDFIPTIFAGQPEVRAELESNLDRFKKDVGFDPRTLDAVAVGLNLDASRRERGFDFACIARGRFDANAAIEAGFASAMRESKGELEKRTQQYEGRTIYVLAPVSRQSKEVGDSLPEVREPSGNTMVFVPLDSNTVAFGNLKSVQATIDAGMGRERVNDELVQLATRTPNAIVSFSGNITPEFADHFFHVSNKKADESIASIRQIYGSFNLSGNDAEALVNVRTETAEQSRQLSSTLNGLKLMARLAGGRENAGEKKSLEVLINSLNIYAVGNEVQLTLKVAAKDLTPFMRNF